MKEPSNMFQILGQNHQTFLFRVWVTTKWKPFGARISFLQDVLLKRHKNNGYLEPENENTSHIFKWSSVNDQNRISRVVQDYGRCLNPTNLWRQSLSKARYPPPTRGRLSVVITRPFNWSASVLFQTTASSLLLHCMWRKTMSLTKTTLNGVFLRITAYRCPGLR